MHKRRICIIYPVGYLHLLSLFTIVRHCGAMFNLLLTMPDPFYSQFVLFNEDVVEVLVSSLL